MAAGRPRSPRTSASTTSKPAAGSRSATASASAAATAPATARPPGAATRATARAPAPSDRARFEGGQNPIHMRMRKLRGPEQEDVDAVRAVPHPHPAREPGRPRAALRRRRRRRPGRAASAPAWPPSATSPSRSSAAASSTRSSPCTRTSSPRRPASGSSPPAGPARSSSPSEADAPMVSTILNAFRVPEIRKKLAFTAAILALYRLGSFIPVPGVNTGRDRADPGQLLPARTSSAS